jgi:hypothetical protein
LNKDQMRLFLSAKLAFLAGKQPISLLNIHLATSEAVMPSPRPDMKDEGADAASLPDIDDEFNATICAILRQISSSECVSLWTTGKPLGR